MVMKRQQGSTTVEFAIVGALLFIMIFGVFEVGRGYYVYSMLDEVTRRASRLAAVCPVSDPAVPQLAVFNASGDASASSLVMGLMPSHVVVDYLDEFGNTVANASDPSSFPLIRYVRARVIGFQHDFIVPFVTGMTDIQMPEFESILPRESLGIPREGAITPC